MIEIKERLRPFSHKPGARCLVPGTKIEVIAYPTRLVVGKKVVEHAALAPIKNFTVVQDLERCCVEVFSDKYRLFVWPNGEVKKEKPPLVPSERLFLGSQKKLEWELVKRRCDLKEILPLWFQLGQKVEATGAFELLELCEKASPQKVVEAFTKLFLVDFRDMLIPRKEDADFQGITKAAVDGDERVLLSKGAALIRALFIEGNHILPKLPPQFVSGKFCNIEMEFGTLDIEWTKKMIRRVVVHAKELPDLQFSKAKRYRVTKKGEMLYLLDRFEK